MGLAHDEARRRGFLGAVCTTIESGEDEVDEIAAKTKARRDQALREKQNQPAAAAAGGGGADGTQGGRSGSGSGAGGGGGSGGGALLRILSTSGAFPTRANKAPTLLVAKGESASQPPAAFYCTAEGASSMHTAKHYSNMTLPHSLTHCGGGCWSVCLFVGRSWVRGS